MEPVFQALADEYCNKANFLEVDIDHATQITNHEDVKSIPLFLYYLGGSKLPEFSLTGADPLKLKTRTLSFITQIPEPVVPELVPETVVVEPIPEPVIEQETTVEQISECLDNLHVCDDMVCQVSEPTVETATTTSEQSTEDEPGSNNECVIVVPMGDHTGSELSKLVLDDIVESDTSGSDSDEIIVIDEMSRHIAEEIIFTAGDNDEYGEECELPIQEPTAEDAVPEEL
jgi:hypothetical protein